MLPGPFYILLLVAFTANSVIGSSADPPPGDSTGAPKLKLSSSTGKGAFLSAYDNSLHVAVGSESAFVLEANAAGVEVEGTLTTSGNVGIGTTSPTMALSVESSASDAAKFMTSTTSSNVHVGSLTTGTGQSSHLYFSPSNAVATAAVKATSDEDASDVGARTSSLYLQVRSNGAWTDAVAVRASGNVGIGTTSPGARLESNGVSNQFLATDAATGNLFYVSNANDELTLMAHKSTTAKMPIVFKQYTSEALRIDESGNVVMPWAPRYILWKHAPSGDDFAYGMELVPSQRELHIKAVASDTRADLVFKTELVGAGSGTSSSGVERMRITSDGRFSIGTSMKVHSDGGVHFGGSRTALDYTTPGVTITKAGGDGTSYIYSVSTFGGTRNVLLNYMNGVYVGGVNMNTVSSSFATSSDARLKANVSDAASVSEKIDRVRVRQFDWKATGAHQDYGVIAQELREIFPEAVVDPSGEEEGGGATTAMEEDGTVTGASANTLSVDYSKLVPMLLKEVQELRARTKRLEKLVGGGGAY